MTNNTPKKSLNIIMSLFLLVGISLAQSPFLGLVLEEVDNGGIVPGTTYRLYAELSEGTLYVIYGDETHPHVIETTTTFYQDANGSDMQSGINSAFFGFVPTMEFDSWVALGDSYDDAPSDIGDLNFSSFNNTSSWSFGGTVNSDASIYRTSDDPLCLPDGNGYVLLGQFTTDGTLSGTLHLRGQDDAGVVWEETASIPVVIAGCTDSAFLEYNSDATEDDGSCSTLVIFGCTDSDYIEYNVSANTDDGSCVTEIINGCTDVNACNYVSTANTDDNSCYNNDLGCGCDTPAADSGYDCSGSCLVDTDGDGVCDQFEIDGCTDSTACNYDDLATDDNTSCVYVDGVCDTCSGQTDGTGTIIDNDSDNDGVCDNNEVLGCTDSTACNYDDLATDNDGSCYNNDLGCGCDTPAADSGYDCSGTCLVDTDGDGVCDQFEIGGCTDSTACNYDDLATNDNTSCVYVDGVCDTCSGQTDGTGTIIDNDSDNDGVCDNNEVLGCTDSTACNYDDLATDNDGSCYNNDLGCGCDTPAADSGYDCSGTCLVDTDGDGVCDQFEIDGCTDSIACNYDDLATDNDGSCYNNDLGCGCDTPAADLGYDCSGTCLVDTDGDGVCDQFEIDGCTDFLYEEYNPLATNDDGSCNTLSLNGCTDITACNYNANAGTDDGSCLYVDGLCETCENGVILANDIDGDGVCDNDEIDGCTNPLACNFDPLATDFNNSCLYANDPCEECDGGAVILNDIDGDGICDDDEILGCTDLLYEEYNPLATDDDGSCNILSLNGCTDLSACNYNSNATDDDGSCLYVDGICQTCINGIIVDNDTDGDGICNEFDLCPNDPNNDADGDGICDDIDACIGDPINDPDGDGICDIDEIDGCQDSLACNYNEFATDDDGSCIYTTELCEICSGDTDGTGFIIDNDSDGDGICDIDEIAGCTDFSACNYNILATDDNGSCIYVDGICETCEDGIIVDNDIDNDGVCDVDDCSPEIYNPDQDCSDINEDDINPFVLYPNPTNSKLFIMNSSNTGVFNVEVMNSLGQYVHSIKFDYSEGEENYIDMGAYSKGIYQVNIVTNNNIQSKLIIVN